jgi:hypothetical protein
MFMVENRSVGAVLASIAVVLLLGALFNALPMAQPEAPQNPVAAQTSPGLTNVAALKSSIIWK